MTTDVLDQATPSYLLPPLVALCRHSHRQRSNAATLALSHTFLHSDMFLNVFLVLVEQYVQVSLC